MDDSNTSDRMPEWAKISLLTDATEYNFRIGYVKIESDSNTLLINKLLGIDDFIEFERGLFKMELIFDNSIPAIDIEEIGWGHWVKEDFVNSIKELLEDVNYDQEVNQIVILLLLFKYFNNFYEVSVPTLNREEGALGLIDFVTQMDEVNSLDCNIKIALPAKIYHFDASAVALLHGVLNQFFKTQKGKRYLDLLNQSYQDNSRLFANVKKLQGNDKLQSQQRFKRKVVQLLFIHLRKYCGTQRQALQIIGTMVEITNRDISIQSFRNLSDYEDIYDSFPEKLRHIVAKFQK